MDEMKVRRRLLTVVFAGAITLIVWLPVAGNAGHRQPNNQLSVTFFDVGQGDAIFIETPDGAQVLIDGGPDAGVLRDLGREMSWLDRDIDLLVSTHPDLDHLGGLIDVLERYRTARILLTENEGENHAAAAFEQLVEAEGAQVIYARAGEEFRLGASTTLRILSPAGNPKELESNTASIVAQLRYGEIEFMLTGDAPQAIENYLVHTYGEKLESEVLKLGHHGSKTSSSAEFLAAVTPNYAVVSAGQDNRYGHPHPEVLERATAAGAQILSTAKRGSITFYSDGKRVWLK